MIFATNNNHKLEEIQRLFQQYQLSEIIQLQSLRDIQFDEEIPETGDTLEDNALEKAKYIYSQFKKDCFADDTGLFIESLNAEPGVYSARYAGVNCSFQDNVDKVLLKMNGIKNRRASFQTVIAAIIGNEQFLFKGCIHGNILEKNEGADGFGYDPIFQPEDYSESFAQMSLDLKNKISHRGLAFNKFAEFLTDKFKV